MPRNGTDNPASFEQFPPSVPVRSLTDRHLIDSLRGGRCPACAGPKLRSHTLCIGDYKRLPPHMKRALYNRLGDGYREAVWEAFAFLKQEKFFLPTGA